MKKFVALAMVLFLCFSVFAQGVVEEMKSLAEAKAAAAVVVEPAVEETKAATYKLGMGVVYADSSTAVQAAYSATVAAVVVDENGVIVDCRIDCAQNKMDTEKIGVEASYPTKYEKGFDYNMVKFSEATNEWFQQADAFCAYVIGKTGEEVAALPTRVRGEDEPHPGYVVTTDETLFASCSITITDFMEAVAKAASDPYAQEFQGEFTLGVAAITDASSSAKATEGKNGAIKMYVEFAAAAVDAEGKILATVTDAIQPSHEVDEFDEIVKATYKGTKKELGFDYNMVKFSEATNEWFQQAAAFEDYCEGLTAAEVLALPTRVRGEEEAHPGYVVTTDETLFASCSISIPGFQNVIAKAAKNAYAYPETAATYKLGMGVVYADSSTAVQAAYSATVAAVVVDENGVIVDCRIDCAQNKMDTEKIGVEASYPTKYEKGFDYNMVKFSEATNEWFQQADAFCAYVIGKTGEEVAALPTRVRGEDEPHPGYVVTTDETLFASCSITITDFMEAVAKAAADPYAQEFQGEFTLGVAAITDASDSKKAEEGKNGAIKMYVEFAAAAVDAEGKILATVTDAIQPSHEVDEFDEIVKATYKGTKKELGFDYNMVKFSEATNEWFQQAAAFEDYCEGLTAAEVLALPTRVRGEEEAHPGYVVTTDETLFASCSISIPGFQNVIAKAADNAR